MEDKYAWLREPIKVSYPESMIEWVATDGKTFKCKHECEVYDRPLRRKQHYDGMMAKRNWLQRFLNLKPNMDLYDSLC